MAELRASLFFVFRAHRHGGTDPEDDRPFVRALVNEIRRVAGPTVAVTAGLSGNPSPAVKEYLDDDDGYVAWLAEHPRGFVVNAWVPATADDPVLHRVSCKWISGRPKRGTWTAGANFKVVSDDIDVLRRWAGGARAGPSGGAGSARRARPPHLDRDTEGTMLVIHFLCRNSLNLHPAPHPFYESGDWFITEQEAERLVGGRIYLHDAKRKQSYIGGEILSYRVVTVDDVANPRRIVFRFHSRQDCKNVAWRGADYQMAWTGGIVTVPDPAPRLAP